MNKFYILSLLIHLLIVGGIFKISEEKEIKFIKKNTMIVSVKNRRAQSSSQEKNLIKNEKPIEQSENKKEVEKIEKEKKIEKVQEKKKKAVKKKKEVKKIKKIKKIEKVEKIEKIVKKKSSKKIPYNEFQDKNRFIQGKDGVFTAVSLEGIEYEILKEVDPKYPIIARKMGYKGEGIVNVSFLVSLDGKVKDIKLISGESKYGFKDEVIKALKKWKFKPIVYKGKRIEVKFEKVFKFRK